MSSGPQFVPKTAWEESEERLLINNNGGFGVVPDLTHLAMHKILVFLGLDLEGPGKLIPRR